MAEDDDHSNDPTPITTFLFRLEADPTFAKYVAEADSIDQIADELGLPSEALEALRDGDLLALQALVDEEHGVTGQVKMLPRGWIRGWIRIADMPDSKSAPDPTS